MRVGYYLNNEYDCEELKLEPPTVPLLDRIVRNILADKPRVTRFPIKWDAVDELEPPPAGIADEPLEDDQVDDLMSQDYPYLDEMSQDSPEHILITPSNDNLSKFAPSHTFHASMSLSKP